MDLGLPESDLRFHDHEKLAHYAKEACDVEYNFCFGWGESMELITVLITIYLVIKSILVFLKSIPIQRRMKSSFPILSNLPLDVIVSS